MLVVATIAFIEAHDNLSIDPDSGPVGTTVELSGECPPPSDSSNGWVTVAIEDSGGQLTGMGDNIPLNADGSWRGEARIEGALPAGNYEIVAACEGEITGGISGSQLDTEPFVVTEPATPPQQEAPTFEN